MPATHDIRCDLPALSRPGRCNWLSFKVGSTGIEVMCPRCRRLHQVSWDRILPALEPLTAST